MRKTALVTGGAVRVGKAIATALADSGYDIVLHYNSSKDRAEQLVQEITNCSIVQHDLQNISNIELLIKDVAATHNNLSLLVNNAAIFERCDFLNTTEKVFDDHMNINFKAPFFLTQAFAKYCTGHVVNILDTKIIKHSSPYFSYLLTKKAMYEFTKMAANELAPDIRVNAICPGTMFPSPYWSQDDIDKKAAKLPLGKQASVADLTDTLLYLVNSQLTGQCIFTDSGESVL